MVAEYQEEILKSDLELRVIRVRVKRKLGNCNTRRVDQDDDERTGNRVPAYRYVSTKYNVVQGIRQEDEILPTGLRLLGDGVNDPTSVGSQEQ